MQASGGGGQVGMEPADRLDLRRELAFAHHRLLVTEHDPQLPELGIDGLAGRIVGRLHQPVAVRGLLPWIDRDHLALLAAPTKRRRRRLVPRIEPWTNATWCAAGSRP